MDNFPKCRKTDKLMATWINSKWPFIICHDFWDENGRLIDRGIWEVLWQSQIMV